MNPTRYRWGAAALIVTVGWLVTPQAVPVYDGIAQPDDPYRYATATVSAPAANASTAISNGASTNGLSISTSETGPQAALFLPMGAFAAPAGTVTVTIRPSAPTDQPSDGKLDGNVYTVQATDPSGPVTVTSKAALATIYLRATTARQPAPVMEHRAAAGQPWQPLHTSRGGADIYVASFPGTGQYALAFGTSPARSTSGLPLLPLVLGGVVVLLGVVVVVIRLRSRRLRPRPT